MQESMVLFCKQKKKPWFHFFVFVFQEKHKQELEDMRKAGHEALSIIVDEYKVEVWESAFSVF